MKYLTIGVNTKTIQDIEFALKEESIVHSVTELKKKFNITIVKNDLRNEFNYANDFLKENNLEDENVFFRDFDISPFGLMIDFKFEERDDLRELHSAVFSIAKKISEVLNAECIFMTNDMWDPVALFKNGLVIKQW